MGDALAVALMRVRGFEAHHFARFHPGGSLGRRLLKRVREEMRTHKLPFVGVSSDVDRVLEVVDECRLGVAIVCDEQQRALGIITDGDLRRALRANGHGFFNLRAEALMSPHPISISIDASMSMAFDLMAKHEITLLVVEADGRVAGVIQK
jgi:arabinose-5-phosphate isomerase